MIKNYIISYLIFLAIPFVAHAMEEKKEKITLKDNIKVFGGCGISGIGAVVTYFAARKARDISDDIKANPHYMKPNPIYVFTDIRLIERSQSRLNCFLGLIVMTSGVLMAKSGLRLKTEKNRNL